MKWLIPERAQWNGWSLPSKVTYLSFLLGVVSIVLTIGLTFINTSIFLKMRYKPEYKVVGKVQKVISNLDKTTYTGTEFDYWPNGGLRNSYYHLTSLVTLAEIENLYGGKIFVDNPIFITETNFDDRFAFRHYSPDFIKWAKLNINEALADTAFVRTTRPLYDTFLSPILTDYAITYLFLEQESDFKNKLLNEYRSYIENGILPSSYIQQTTLVEGWSDTLVSDATAYKMLMKVSNDTSLSSSLLSIVVGTDQLLHDKRHILARDQEVRRNLQRLMKKGNSNIMGPAIYFWLRRTLDGTDKEIFSVVQIVMTKYAEADYYNLAAEVSY